MKKRILSLMMAVCMVAALVPAVLLSVTAAENVGFTTTLVADGENWPTYGETMGEYKNGWMMGCLKSGVFTVYSHYNSTYQIAATTPNGWWDATTGTGIYIGKNGRIILVGGSAPYYGEATENGVVTYGTKNAFTYTYTAQYEGVVDLNITAFRPAVEEQTTPIPEGQEPMAYAAIMINDRMIWPTAGGSVTNPADMKLLADTKDFAAELEGSDLLKNVEVNIGDQIHFVVAKYNTWFAYMQPSVTYHDGYAVVPTRMNQTFTPSSVNWPAVRGVNGNGDLKQIDDRWTLGAFKTADASFVKHVAQCRRAVDIWTGVNRETVDFDKNSGILLKSSEQLTGAFFFGTEDTKAGVYPAYQAIVVASGEAEFSLAPKSLYVGNENQQAVKNASATVEVYKNGTNVGTITVTTDASGKASASEALTGVSVKKGDTILFVAKGGTGVKTLTASPVITLSNISSFMIKESTEKYDMAVEAAQVAVGNKITLRFRAYATIDTYRDASEANLYVWDASVTDKKLENASAVLPMTIDSDYAYTAVYDGFAPKEMKDAITTQIVVKNGDAVLCQSALDTVTVADAATKQFNASHDEAERKLLAAVLNYGSYAQKYFNYHADDLANKELDPSYTNLNVDDYLYYSKFNYMAIGSMFTASEIEGFSLYLDNSISLRLYLKLDEYEVQKSIMYIQYGTSEDECINDRTGLAVDLEKSSALLENIGLRSLSRVHYLRLRAQEGRYSYIGYMFTYSVESFAARMMDSDGPNLPELLCAMMELSKLAQ